MMRAEVAVVIAGMPSCRQASFHCLRRFCIVSKIARCTNLRTLIRLALAGLGFLVCSKFRRVQLVEGCRVERRPDFSERDGRVLPGL